MLMDCAKEIVLPVKIVPEEGKPLRSDHKLQNDLTNVLASLEIGWSLDSVVTLGESCMKCLVST